MSDGEQESWIEDIVRELRRPIRLSLNFDRRVMAAVRAEQSRQPNDLDERRGWRWSITLTPLRATAIAAGLAALAVGSGWLFSRGLRPAMPRARAAAVSTRASISRAPHAVQFVVVARDAAEVSLVGDFNNWSATATPMRLESAGGVWSVTVPLPAGRYQYAFVINGREWRADPAAPAAPVDDFGAPNSILAVTDQTS